MDPERMIQLGHAHAHLHPDQRQAVRPRHCRDVSPAVAHHAYGIALEIFCIIAGMLVGWALTEMYHVFQLQRQTVDVPIQ